MLASNVASPLSCSWKEMSRTHDVGARRGSVVELDDGTVVCPPSYEVRMPDGSKTGGYQGVFSERDSLDRTSSLDETLPDRVRASLVRGAGAFRNPDLTKLFNHMDADKDGYLVKTDLVVKLLSMEDFQLSTLEAESIFARAARGRSMLSLEAFLDWCSGRTVVAGHGTQLGPGSYGSPSCPSLGWRALAGVSIGKVSSYQKVADQLRVKLKQVTKYDIRSIFAHFDKDGNMELDMSEFREGLLSLGVETLTEDQLFTVFKEVDGDSTGSISYREFVTWLAPVHDDPYITTTELAFEITTRAAVIKADTKQWHT
jgi:Ca2+-binding EF-hand superfamily protein